MTSTIWKPVIKRSLQLAISKVGRQTWSPWSEALVILMYHRVLPGNYPGLATIQPGMTVTPEAFQMHIDTLKGLFRIVDLNSWVSQVRAGRSVPKKACAITFDDGWCDNFHYAYPILVSENVPATIFVVTDMVGTRRTMWPDRLAQLLWNRGQGLAPSVLASEPYRWLRDLTVPYSFDGVPPTRDELDQIICKAKELSDTVIANKIDAMESVAPNANIENEHDFLDWKQLHSMVASGLISVGSHTRRHTRLRSGLDTGMLQDEIVGAKNEIERRLGGTVNVFCYPDGKTIPRAEQIVRNNYVAACTTGHGWNSTKSDLFRLKRIPIHQDIAHDKTSFLARLSGWL